jgi:phosphoribosylformylglycinamidine synthase
VTGGNVSFYNESGDSAIWPTPVIGMLGLLQDYRLAVPSGFPVGDAAVYLLGETLPELGGGEFAEVVLGTIAGRAPVLDLEREQRLHLLLVEGAGADLLASAHDCSDGGLAVALAESAIAGGTGFAVGLPGDLPAHVALFSESASRAVVSVDPARIAELEDLAGTLGVPIARLGETGGPRIAVDGVLDLALTEAAAAYEEAIAKLLAG